MGDAKAGPVRLSLNPQQRSPTGLFRQSVYSRLAGSEDINDAERLAEDPAFRMRASRERRETRVALTSTAEMGSGSRLGGGDGSGSRIPFQEA